MILNVSRGLAFTAEMQSAETPDALGEGISFADALAGRTTENNLFASDAADGEEFLPPDDAAQQIEGFIQSAAAASGENPDTLINRLKEFAKKALENTDDTNYRSSLISLINVLTEISPQAIESNQTDLNFPGNTGETINSPPLDFHPEMQNSPLIQEKVHNSHENHGFFPQNHPSADTTQYPLHGLTESKQQTANTENTENNFQNLAVNENYSIPTSSSLKEFQMITENENTLIHPQSDIQTGNSGQAKNEISAVNFIQPKNEIQTEKPETELSSKINQSEIKSTDQATFIPQSQKSEHLPENHHTSQKHSEEAHNNIPASIMKENQTFTDNIGFHTEKQTDTSADIQTPDLHSETVQPQNPLNSTETAKAKDIITDEKTLTNSKAAKSENISESEGLKSVTPQAKEIITPQENLNPNQISQANIDAISKEIPKIYNPLSQGSQILPGKFLKLNSELKPISASIGKTDLLQGDIKSLFDKIMTVITEDTPPPAPSSVEPFAAYSALRGKIGMRIIQKPSEFEEMSKNLLNSSDSENEVSIIPRTIENSRAFLQMEEIFKSAPTPVHHQIGKEITARISNLENGDTTFEMELNPASLGKIVVKLISESGKISVKITSERPETAMLLRERSEHLITTLKDNGVNLQNYEVETPRQENPFRDNGGQQHHKEEQSQNETHDDDTDDALDFEEFLRDAI